MSKQPEKVDKTLSSLSKSQEKAKEFLENAAYGEAVAYLLQHKSEINLQNIISALQELHNNPSLSKYPVNQNAAQSAIHRLLESLKK